MMAGDVGGQALREGLVDRVILHLVPMVMHTGRSFFGDGGVGATIAFDNPRSLRVTVSPTSCTT